MTDLRVAKVIKAHPEANAVDIVYLDDGSRVPLVQVMGHVDRSDIPEPTPPDDAKAPQRRTGKRDVYCYVGTVWGVPIVIGFQKPQVHRNLFKNRPNFRVDEHPSGVYQTLDDAGNFTKVWPNGTALVVGEDPEPEDLAGKDFDEKWAAPDRNTDREMHMRLVIKSGGVQKALIHITPDGAATIELADTLDLTVAGAVTATADSWNFTGPATFEDQVTVNANVQVNGTATATTDVIGGGKSLKNHTHQVPGVQAGGATVSSNAPT